MENYAYNSYPDSGHSSPRSRDVDFDNTQPPWDDPHNHKPKFMCSYGGKIHPRPHDNNLTYVGGDTKILSVDRSIKFSSLLSKLASLCGDPSADVSFKYQLPGEDLDALISVTNDDDLEHMMIEYDRLYRASPKPARMRLFLFSVSPSPAQSFGSDGGKLDRERFVEALNSGPSQVVEDSTKMAPNRVDFLFGLEKGVPPPPPPVKVPELQETVGREDRVIGSDHLDLQTQMQGLQIRELEQQNLYGKSGDDNLVRGGYAGEYYFQKLPEKVSQASLQSKVPAPPGYWPENQVHGGFAAPMTVTTTPSPTDQPVYMIQAPGPVYHPTPMVRAVTGQTGQGYYMQRIGGPPPPDAYREQPVYNVVPPPQQPPHGNMAVARSSGPMVTDTGYTQVAYDSGGGRQVFYTAPGGVGPAPPPPYQGGGGVAVSGDMRGVGVPLTLGFQEGKGVSKIPQH